MKAVVIEHAGGPEVVNISEVPTPEVKPGWSLVKVRGFGINRSEVYTRNGESPDVKFPRVLGIECVGEIAATTQATRLPVGQRVVSMMGGMGRDFDGSYAEYVLLPNAQIYPVTTTLSWPELAAVPETYFTAYGALLNAHANTADTLLIRGATSGVGVAAAKLARALNPKIRVTGSTRAEQKFDLLSAVGVDEPVLDKDAKVKTEGRFDAIVELVGTQTLLDSLAHLSKGGYCCLLGGLADEWVVKNFNPFSIPTGAYLTVFSSGDEVSEQRFQDMLGLIEKQHVDVMPAQQFDLEHTSEAMAALETAGSFGKVVVLP